MQRGNLFFKQFIATAIILSSLFTAFAQTKRGSSGTWTTKGCTGGWSGVVTFKKTLKDSLESDQPGIRKSIDRIKHKTSRDYDYTARAIVDGTIPNQPTVNTKVNFTDKSLQWGEERVFDSCNSRENGHWFIIEGIDNRFTEAQASGSAQSFNLSVNEMEGNYSFNLRFPHAQGTLKRVEDVKRSGHCQAKNNEPLNRNTNEPFKIEGEGFSIYGEKIDPNNPDTISGSKTWGDDGKGAVRSFVYTITWRFTRCPNKLLITDLRFEDMKFPKWDDWQEIVEQKGTIDGNWIRIKAKVLNMSAETKFAEISFKETYKGDRWNGAKPDYPLKDSSVSVRLEAGEEREVEILWNSSGYAWFDDGRPRDMQRIKVEAWENFKKQDELTKNLKIAPKPLILVHGLFSNEQIWNPLYQNLLTSNHSYQWKAYAVGEKPEYGKMNMGGKILVNQSAYTVYENADEVAKYVRHAQLESNAWHIDMVAHSTGGLVARLYIQKLMPQMPDNQPQVKHLMMLGTPNNGAPCIDVFVGKFGLFPRELRTANEIKSEEIQRFNQSVKNRNGTKFSALVGNSVPIICGGFEWNDSFVTVNSAKYGVEDFAYSNDLNHQLVDSKNFSNFVKPHLVTGPKGTYPLPVKSDPNNIDRWKVNSGLQNSFENNFADVSYSPKSLKKKAEGENPQTFSKELSLAPKQVVELEMPVQSANNLGVTFMADSSVSVSLVNEKGIVVSKNLSDSPLARAIFRGLFVEKAVTKSVWKLRVENTSYAEQIFLGFSWSADNSTNKTPLAE